jgi:CobQ-like glutamine amidotransferase family enzyme
MDMKEIKIQHLFPKLLSLYGEYGNIAIMRRTLEENGCSVAVDGYETGAFTVEDYDLIYVGAGTEDNLLEAAKRLMPYKDTIRSSVEKGQLWLATGNAMTLFGNCVMRGEDVSEALGCFPYVTTIHDSKRYLGDVLTAEGFEGEFVGFVNTSCVYEGITAPLLQFKLGTKLGNNKLDGADGIREGNFYGTELIGPVLVKNPHFLAHLCRELTGQEITLSKESYAVKAYDVALSELTKRMQ